MRSALSALLSAAIAAHAALATPVRARSAYSVKEKHYVPRSWTKLERANGQNRIELQIGLKQGNFDELERHLYEGTRPFLVSLSARVPPPLRPHTLVRRCNRTRFTGAPPRVEIIRGYA